MVSAVFAHCLVWSTTVWLWFCRCMGDRVLTEPQYMEDREQLNNLPFYDLLENFNFNVELTVFWLFVLPSLILCLCHSMDAHSDGINKKTNKR